MNERNGSEALRFHNQGAELWGLLPHELLWGVESTISDTKHQFSNCIWATQNEFYNSICDAKAEFYNSTWAAQTIFYNSIWAAKPGFTIRFLQNTCVLQQILGCEKYISQKHRGFKKLILQ